jgi:Na+-transporting methylmalonyl-CoA/oxaloacetate decarboxylase gamma subunit
MKFSKRSIAGIGLVFAAVVLLSMSMSAQQEVSPDHFDDNPVATKQSKPAPKPAKVAAKKPSAANQNALKPKAAPAQHESAQSSAAPVQTASNR